MDGDTGLLGKGGTTNFQVRRPLKQQAVTRRVGIGIGK